MGALAGFSFTDVSNLPSFDDAFVGIVPRHVSSVGELMEGIADALSFPPYFGRNWDALYDCLRDFHWTHNKNIVLVHCDLPSLTTQELKIYLEILRDAARDWKSGEAHELHVLFDKSLEPMVLNELKPDAI